VLDSDLTVEVDDPDLVRPAGLDRGLDRPADVAGMMWQLKIGSSPTTTIESPISLQAARSWPMPAEAARRGTSPRSWALPTAVRISAKRGARRRGSS